VDTDLPVPCRLDCRWPTTSEVEIQKMAVGIRKAGYRISMSCSIDTPRPRTGLWGVIAMAASEDGEPDGKAQTAGLLLMLPT
jgi:hypothetical protein